LAVFGAVFSVFTYVVARRACSRASALFMAGVVTAATLPYRFLVLHNWDSTLWACLALYSALKLVECEDLKLAFAVGSFASLTFLFEQSKGAGLSLGLGLGFAVLYWLKLFRRFLWEPVLSGFALPLLLTLAYFTAQRSLWVMVTDWLWPLAHYSVANRVPYGFQGWSDATRHVLFGSGPWLARIFYAITFSPTLWIPALPLFGCALLIYWIVRVRRGDRSAKAGYYILVNANICGLLLSVIAARADILHFMYLLPIFGLALAWIVDGRDIPARWFERAKPAVIAYLAFAFLLFSAPLLMRAALAPYAVATRRGVVGSS